MGNEVVFALDSSGKTASVCVMRGSEVLFCHTLDEGLTHSETLLALAQRGFGEAGITPAEVACYAVTAGPGSFTGLRIGMSLVKGLALPHATPAVGVSTLEALAMAAVLEARVPKGRVVAALDARRSEVYWAAFSVGGKLERLVQDTASPISKIAHERVFCEEPVFFVGDGAKLCYNMYNYSFQCVLAEEKPALPIAKGAAHLVANIPDKNPLLPAGELRPQYLRLSQAERERKERLG